VITAGNHDSPTFLEAPKPLLKVLGVRVIGGAGIEEELLLLKDSAGRPEILVAAVPYLRDREIRTAVAGESIAVKERKLIAGIRDHYAELAAAARQLQARREEDIPVIATGHLFAAGGEIIDGDGVRNLYIGSLGRFPAADFPALFDYIALGHLHQPQMVDGKPHIRYSGSPLAHGFGEAGRRKCVLVVEIKAPAVPEITELPVPVFQPLARLTGDREAIAERLRELIERNEPVWLEITYEGAEPAGGLRDELEELIADHPIEILNLRHPRALEIARQGLTGDTEDHESLDALDPEEVFERRLETAAVPEESRPELRAAYREILTRMYEKDNLAEETDADRQHTS
jgi:exonuclease SbcD